MLGQNKRYNRAIVFSGGGTRFAIYCGMFAALEDTGLAPDLIIGACGGGMATVIINSFATNKERREYLQSEELYEFVRSTKLTKERMLYRIGWLCLKKMYAQKNAFYIENVFDHYLVDMPNDISLHLPSLSQKAGLNISSIIIGSQLLFGKSEVCKLRNDRKLYKKVLFTDKATAHLIDCSNIEIRSCNYKASAIESTINLMTDVPMLTAMRISVSDMFYIQPVQYQDAYYAGGAIDLMPIELASSMANHIILERKSHYTRIEESLVRAVLGYGGNERLKDIEKNGKVEHWIDTFDAIQTLNEHYCKKTIDWARLQVKMILPHSYQQFKEDMEMQWQYGYDKVINQLKL